MRCSGNSIGSLFVLIVCLLGLVSCNSRQTDASTAKQTSEQAVQLDAAIPPAKLSTGISAIGHLTYFKGSDSLFIRIRIWNRGTATLSNVGKFPVRLGATLAGPDGIDKPPGNRNFMRLELPLIPAHSSVVVDAIIPARDILGLDLGFDLVQENVAWFSWYGLPALDVGIFRRCADQPDTLCNASGVAVASGSESDLFKHPAKRAL